MKLLRIAAILMCVMLLLSCTMFIYAGILTEDDDGDDIAYTPTETVEYEGYHIGTSGIVTIIILAAITIGITVISVRRAVKDNLYNIA